MKNSNVPSLAHTCWDEALGVNPGQRDTMTAFFQYTPVGHWERVKDADVAPWQQRKREFEASPSGGISPKEASSFVSICLLVAHLAVVNPKLLDCRNLQVEARLGWRVVLSEDDTHWRNC